MEVEEAPDVRVLYDLWLVRWGEESFDVDHALNNDLYWYNTYRILRQQNLLHYDYSTFQYKLAAPPWK